MSAQILTLALPAAPARLRALADLLERDDVFDAAFDLIAGIRDQHPRHVDDIDSGVLLTEFIAALRAAS